MSHTLVASTVRLSLFPLAVATVCSGAAASSLELSSGICLSALSYCDGQVLYSEGPILHSRSGQQRIPDEGTVSQSGQGDVLAYWGDFQLVSRQSATARSRPPYGSVGADGYVDTQATGSEMVTIQSSALPVGTAVTMRILSRVDAQLSYARAGESGRADRLFVASVDVRSEHGEKQYARYLWCSNTTGDGYPTPPPDCTLTFGKRLSRTFEKVVKVRVGDRIYVGMSMTANTFNYVGAQEGGSASASAAIAGPFGYARQTLSLIVDEADVTVLGDGGHNWEEVPVPITQRHRMSRRAALTDLVPH